MIQPIVKLANEPKAKCGKRTTPPETGNIVPSSAKVRPMQMIMAPPMAQERIAAGPASCEASSAPKSQPEPMIEPTPANSSPVRPMWRFSPLVSSSGWSESEVALSGSLGRCAGSVTVITRPLTRPRRR